MNLSMEVERKKKACKTYIEILKKKTERTKQACSLMYLMDVLEIDSQGVPKNTLSYKETGA